MPRKPGQRTGRDEGLVLNVVRRKATPKSRAYSQGPTQKFGFAGGTAAPSPVRLKLDAGHRSGSSSSASRNALHWHRDQDGTIQRGEAPIDEPVEHIHKLSYEHVRKGHLVAFEIPHLDLKGEGEITAYGHHGVTIRDPEGLPRRLFYHELTEVRKPEPPEAKKPKAKKKKEPQVTGNNIRSILHGIRQWWKGEREKKKKAK